MLKSIGDAAYDCMRYEDIAKLVGYYVNIHEKPNYAKEYWKMARHKLMKWIMNESCIRMVLRDYGGMIINETEKIYITKK